MRGDNRRAKPNRERMMTNNEMKSERFLQWHRCRLIVSQIKSHLHNGGTVYIGTNTKCTKFSKKHEGMFKATRGGAYFQSGKKWVCFDSGLAYRMCGIKLA
jgi:hypothetical protein